MKRLLIILFALLLLTTIVLPVSAEWQIQSPDYQGTIQFYDNGMGLVKLVNYPPLTFSYSLVSPEHYIARYWWYEVPFQSTNGIITSPQFPNSFAYWSEP